jgi:hypothetical protein
MVDVAALMDKQQANGKIRIFHDGLAARALR